MAEIHSLEELCSQTHEILQSVTQDLPIPAEDKARSVRKMISVFTYSVIKELSSDTSVHEDDIYLRYLMGGGLTGEQGRTVINRTREEFVKNDYGEACMQAGKEVVQKWKSGDQDIKTCLHKLLA